MNAGRKRQHWKNTELQNKYQLYWSTLATRRNADEAEPGFSAKRTKIAENETETSKEAWKTLEQDFKGFLKAHGLITKLKARKVYRGTQLKVCQNTNERVSHERHG